MAGVSDKAGSAARDASAALGRLWGGLGRLVTLPVALILALAGQFALGGFIMSTSPPPDIGAGAANGAIWAQGLVLSLQAAALYIAVSRGGFRPAHVFLAIAALVWAVASLLLLYVAFQCDLGGVCL